MKTADIITLIESNRESIVKAMRAADHEAYHCTSCKYEVHLLPDGRVDTRERLAGDDWWRIDDPAVCEIACYCYQYYDVLYNAVPDTDLVRDLLAECTPAEREAYAEWLAEYRRGAAEAWDEEEDPCPSAIIQWFRGTSPAWDRLRDYTIDTLVDDTDYDAQLDELIKSLAQHAREYDEYRGEE